MANTNLPVTDASRAGQNYGVNGALEVQSVAGNNHTFNNDGKIVVLCRNAGATPRIVTAIIQKTTDGITPAAKSISVAATGGAGDQMMFGPFTPDVYNVKGGADDGLVYLTSAHLDVKFQAIRINPQ